MAIAKKAVVWGLFAAGGTLAAFVLPALIALYLMAALGFAPDGLRYESMRAFAANGFVRAGLFGVLFLFLWHAAHRLRVVFHDFGVRKDRLVANTVYLAAAAGSVMAAYVLYSIP